jgi:hypothetical protein
MLIIPVLVSLYNGFNLIRILFAFWIYFSGVPFVLLPFLVVKNKNYKFFLKYMVFIFLFLSIGLIVDHLFGIFNFIKIQSGQDFMAAKGDLMRASFLLESPTALGGLFIFLLCMTLHNLSLKNTVVFDILNYIAIYLGLIAAFFTGSRQVFIPALVITFLYVFVFMVTGKSLIKKGCVLLFFLALIFVGNGIENLVTQSDAKLSFLDRMENIEGGNRVEKWKLGIDQLNIFSDNFKYIFLGHGIGSTMGQHAESGEEQHSHFESSVWAVLYECGYYGWFVLFWPTIFSLYCLIGKKNSSLKFVSVLFFLYFVFVSTISPNGLHFTFQMCQFIMLGIALNLEIFNSNPPEE